MSMGITNDYSQFYKGTQDIASYGSGGNQKTKLVKYEFNTTDENGNHVMDKMTKEETMRTLNEISAMYDDSVIVSFSGDGLAALAESKAYSSDFSNYRKRTLDGKPFDVEEHLKSMELQRERMERFQTKAPEVYQEYLTLKSNNRGGEAQSLYCEFVEKTEGREYWGNKKLSDDGLSFKKEDVTQGEEVLNNRFTSLSKTYSDANFYTSMPDYSEASADKYNVVLSKKQEEAMNSDDESERDQVHNLIKKSLASITDFFNKNRNNTLFGAFKLGFEIGSDGNVSFFAQNKANSFFGSTMDSLMDKLMGQN